MRTANANPTSFMYSGTAPHLLHPAEAQSRQPAPHYLLIYEH
jgi:hypothetical protein